MVKRISLEREIAVWKGRKPLDGQETADFKDRIDQAKNLVEGLTCTDREVAANSIEMKFSLIQKESAGASLTSARREIGRLASEAGYTAFWTNQPRHTPSGHNEYFTTLAFPSLVELFIHGNSIHVHNEVEAARAIHAYRQMNALAPWFIMSSRQPTEIDRLHMVAEFRDSMRELMLPQDLHSMDDYNEYMRMASGTILRILADNGNLAKAMGLFPGMFPDGRDIALTPDKVFHPARFRPDLMLPNGNISVEFRALDGIGTLAREIELVETAVLAFDAALDAPPILSVQSVRNFYDELTTRSKAYRVAEEFVQEAVKSARGNYLEAVNE